MRAVYTIFGFLDVWGHLPVNFFLKDDLGWSPSQVTCPHLLRVDTHHIHASSLYPRLSKLC